MLQYEELRLKLEGMLPGIEDLAGSIGLTQLRREVEELDAQAAAPGFWDNMEFAQKVTQKAASLKGKIEAYEKLQSDYQDTLTLIELADEAEDPEMVPEIQEEFNALKAELESLRLTTLLNDEYDANDCILALHAGAGGTEAQDWTQMLYRMYTRFAARKGFTVKELDLLDGDEAGVKSVTFEVSGEYAYGFLKSERGVHRLVRISPFDSNARRQTSFSSLDVAPVIEDDGAIEIKMEDLRIDTYRASGAATRKLGQVWTSWMWPAAPASCSITICSVVLLR